MADFVQSNITKSAVRELAEPIEDVATFNTIVQSVIDDNPFDCVAYMTAGLNHDPVEKTREGYTTKIVYHDIDAKIVGSRFSRTAPRGLGHTVEAARYLRALKRHSLGPLCYIRIGRRSLDPYENNRITL